MASRAGCARPGYGHGLDEDKDEAAAMDPDRKKPWREGKGSVLTFGSANIILRILQAHRTSA
jgi:hypothetical protein